MDHKLTFDLKKQAQLRSIAASAPEGAFRALVETLVDAPENYRSKNAVLQEFRATLKVCQKLPSAEKEALVSSLERVLDVFGIESSDGLLNEWLQGISL